MTAISPASTPAGKLPLTSNPACNPECRVCHYKDLDYSAQLQRKQSWAVQQLGHWRDALREIRPAPESERLGYRAKSWMRSSHDLSFGMFRSIRMGNRWEKEFVDWSTCPLHAEPIREMVGRIRRTWPLSDFVQDSLVGIWFGSPHLVVVSRDPDPRPLTSVDWDQLLVPPFNRAWFHHNDQVGAKIFGHRPLLQLAGPPVDSAHPVRAFRQAAHTLLSEARALAVRSMLERSPKLVLDFYCGTGDLSRLLPPEIGWIGIEQSREAVNFANSMRTGTAYVGNVEQRLVDPQVLSKVAPPYALFINPPRTGLSPDAGEALFELIKSRPPVSVAYLSCSASSLARDLRLFEDRGYGVALLQPYDFFPQTEHFETLAILAPPEFTSE